MRTRACASSGEMRPIPSVKFSPAAFLMSRMRRTRGVTRASPREPAPAVKLTFARVLGSDRGRGVERSREQMCEEKLWPILAANLAVFLMAPKDPIHSRTASTRSSGARLSSARNHADCSRSCEAEAARKR